MLTLPHAAGPDSGRRRRQARLGAALGLIALAAGACGAPRTQTVAIDPDEPLATRAGELLSRAIRIPTAHDDPRTEPDAERRLAAMLVAELSAAGIEARLIDTPPEQPGGTPRAAAWARVPGARRGDGTLLLSHLDVVPAQPEQWSVDPYAGRIVDGTVWGRGALDAKGVAIVHLLTLVELASRGRPPPRDVFFLATPGEERGGRDGAGYLVRERPDLLAGVGSVLTEGGGIRVPGPSGGRPVWSVSITEKAPCWMELRTRGVAGHSSTPKPDGAVARLVAALDRVRRIETPIRVRPEVEEMFRRAAPLAAPEDRAGYLDLRAHLETDDAFRRRFVSSPARSALVRNTLAITVLEGASQTNVIPAEARARLDARLLPGERCERFRNMVEEVIADPQVELREILSFPSRSSSPDTDAFRAIERTAAEIEPDALVLPRMIAGFTDAHWFREAGLVAYGFVPRWLATSETRGIHGSDERVSLENLERGVRTLIRILDELE